MFIFGWKIVARNTNQTPIRFEEFREGEKYQKEHR